MGVGYLDCASFRKTLDMLVIAFCSDYAARKRLIEAGECTRRTVMEYKYLNGIILEAAEEVVGRYAETYIDEIGKSVGYAYSEVDDISETTYKKIKREVKINIARRLHLID